MHRASRLCANIDEMLHFARIGPHKAAIAVRQVHDEEMRLLLDTTDDHHPLAEVGLSVPGRMRQRHEHLAAAPFALPHVVFHDRVATGEPVLFAKPLEYSLRRVPLHHLNYLIAEPIKAAVTYRSGVLVQIPQPERFAIHKLIVADRRRAGGDVLKVEKDRRQAAFLIEVLAMDRPDELRDAYEDALSRGPKWKSRVEASLQRMPETARRLAGV